MIKHIVLITIMLMSSSCSTFKEPKTLFEQLNGKPGIEKLVDSFIRYIANDKDIFPYFAKASVSHFREGFITHLCDVTGGPCVYKGDNMIDIHTGMNISEAHFNKVVELLVNAMEDNNIDYTTQNKVLALLAPMRSEIIKI